MSDDYYWNSMATVNWYREGIRSVVERDRTFTGWTVGTIRVALVNSAYIPSQSHTSFADVSSYEISGGDYVPGGTVLTGKTIATSTNQLRLDALDLRWDSMPNRPRYAIIYDATNAATNQQTLLGYTDLGSLRGRRLRIRWPSSGVLVLTVEDAPGLP